MKDYTVWMFLLWHNTPPEENISLANTKVAEYYYHGKWVKPKEPILFGKVFAKITRAKNTTM